MDGEDLQIPPPDPDDELVLLQNFFSSNKI